MRIPLRASWKRLMSLAAFIDANVPIYAAGRDHGNKAPCAQGLMMATEHPRSFVTDVEVLQELLHCYLSLDDGPREERCYGVSQS